VFGTLYSIPEDARSPTSRIVGSRRITRFAAIFPAIAVLDVEKCEDATALQRRG